jgi:hypothetical protein
MIGPPKAWPRLFGAYLALILALFLARFLALNLAPFAGLGRRAAPGVRRLARTATALRVANVGTRATASEPWGWALILALLTVRPENTHELEKNLPLHSLTR